SSSTPAGPRSAPPDDKPPNPDARHTEDRRHQRRGTPRPATAAADPQQPPADKPASRNIEVRKRLGRGAHPSSTNTHRRRLDVTYPHSSSLCCSPALDKWAVPPRVESPRV